jgi:hypothetical protein
MHVTSEWQRVCQARPHELAQKITLHGQDQGKHFMACGTLFPIQIAYERVRPNYYFSKYYNI